MWEEAAADISQTVHSVFSPIPHLIPMLQVCRRSWRWWNWEAASFFCPLSILIPVENRNELVWSSEPVYSTSRTWPSVCNNPSVPGTSQQVGNWITCPVAQLELRAALPTSAFGGITDIFHPCRRVKPQCVLFKKSCSNAQGLRPHNLPHDLPGLFSFITSATRKYSGCRSAASRHSCSN